MPRVKEPPVTKTTDADSPPVETLDEPQTEMLSLFVEIEVPKLLPEGYNDARCPKPSLNSENASKLKRLTLALIGQQATIEAGGTQFNGTTNQRPRKLVQRPQDALTWLIEHCEFAESVA